MIDLKNKPFNLDNHDIRWVEDTLASMSLEEKVGQLFCEIVWDKPGVEAVSAFSQIQPGGVMFRPDTGLNIQKQVRLFQGMSKIPMLIAGNLERGGSGGNGGLKDGTYFGSPMQVAATDDQEQAYRLGLIASREGCAVGMNWTFEPIIDIDFNFDNPITNVRTFGSDPDRVLKMALAHMKGTHENEMAVTIKHFPGDGVDSRDQHLLASVNTMGVEDWEATFGKIYRKMIDAGAGTLMASHIKLPSWTKAINPQIRDEDIMPASLSPELLNGLIRQEMGFNGVIVSDATQMAGFTVSMPRKQAVPHCIAAGCDMFLFTINHDEDVEYMFDGIKAGILSHTRLDEAVCRILALKASLKLHIKKQQGNLVPAESGLSVLKCPQHITWAKECAEKAITLVKNKENLIPLSPIRHKRILLSVITNEPTDSNGQTLESVRLIQRLEEQGFIVTLFNPRKMPGGLPGNTNLKQLQADHDLIIYFANMRVASNQTSVRITWSDFLGEDAPKYVKDIPTMFISASNPYHLFDVPMVQTYINAYSSNVYVIDALIRKLIGESPFVGSSPVDPFCGLWDTRL